MLNPLFCSGFIWTGSHFPKAAVYNSQNKIIGHQTLLELLIISPQFSRSALTSLMGLHIVSLKYINYFILSPTLKVQILLRFFNGEAKVKSSTTVDTAAWSWECSFPPDTILCFPSYSFFPVDLQWYSLTLIDNVSSSLDLSFWGDTFVLLTYTVPEAEEDTDASHLLGYIASEGESLFCSGNLPRLFSVY